MWFGYARLIVRHSFLILLVVTLVCTVLTVIPLVCRELPTFTDPIIGFETRGTSLANRFIAWENLIDETRPSRSLAVNPEDIENQIRYNQTYRNKTNRAKFRSGLTHRKNKNRKKKQTIHFNTTTESSVLNQIINSSKIHIHWGYGKNISFEDENSVFLKDHIRRQWISIKEMRRYSNNKPVFHENYASGGCGSPIAGYAHLVVTSRDNSSLLSFKYIKEICELQSRLIEVGDFTYYKLCQRLFNSEEMCCPMWSLPNYIALMGGKDSCLNITEDDVNRTLSLLQACAPYFHNFKLMASCDLDQCEVPKYCTQYNAIYNLLFYIIDADAFTPTNHSQTFVRNTMIFLPLPCSSTLMPYYKKMSSSLNHHLLDIVGIDFCLKNALFDVWVVEDAWLVALGGVFVFCCVWVYSKSFILSIMLFVAIGYSLGTAYFLYVYIYSLNFFPFMNLLVIVVVIGIGADDAFLYLKVWKTVAGQIAGGGTSGESGVLSDIKNIASAGETILIQIVEETLKHSVLTMFITTLTTAVAFFASYVSHIPAINCFSIFAGTAVLVNFILMMTWLPAMVFILDVKMNITRLHLFNVIYKPLNEVWEDARIMFNRVLVYCVSKLNIMFILFFGSIGLWSIIAVSYYPGLRLPDSKQFQLFQSSHPFERYDKVYKEKFLFERLGHEGSGGMRMPLRWVWGVKAVDNGNHMNPISTGHLELDKSFSLSDPDSQVWLLGFCARLKAQPFYQPTLGPLLPNCFIESFKMFMSRRCIDKIDKIDRRPCCEASRFPYARGVFEQCVARAAASLYSTPALAAPGVAGPKFLRSSSNPPPLVALVVEFESAVPYSLSYSEMDRFYETVENWTRSEMRGAPAGIRGGWFVSELQFYDVQRTLAGGTVTALALSAGLGFLVLLPATLSPAVSVCALLSVTFSCTTTVGALAWAGWRLNVVESVAVSTSTGLAVDFSLHYALSYAGASGGGAARARAALAASAGPTAAAALTTAAAGVFLLGSNLLPYSQIGAFLALITSVSWAYGTFFLCSVLHRVRRSPAGSQRSGVAGGTGAGAGAAERKPASRVSSVCSALPQLESHELEALADSGRTNVTHDRSPSARSATTLLLHEDRALHRPSLSDNEPLTTTHE